MKIVAIVQARMDSTRLPGKVMKIIGGVPLIELLLNRLAQSREIDEIVIATSVNTSNSLMIEHVRSLGYSCYLGSEDDVLDRFVSAAKEHQADVIVRITGDCPLIDPNLIDEAISLFRDANVDYFSNIAPPSYPDGLDVEVFTTASLIDASYLTDAPFDREHVTSYLRSSGKYKTDSMRHIKDLSFMRWTVDEASDLKVIEKVFEYFSFKTEFSWIDVLHLYEIHPELFKYNKHLVRNEGARMGTGQKLWRRAKNVIPGGNMLLSKRAEMFLPEFWPTYFSRAKGCEVWDLDGNKYIDMSIMSVGTNILGYGHPEVDEVVLRTVNSGNMSTLNCPEEVYLAEKLIEIHPWADMVRLARTGGEANALAIRIARASSGRDGVAICGYHGWHDWYLSANLSNDKNLDGHLLPGLDPSGVPRNLKDTIYPFSYNNFFELEKLVNTQKIGVIKMEVSRNVEPEDDFLQKVRKLATEKNIVLIFDECTSGFRETFGGLHKKYGVEPDMAIFGKALGNGYAITAVIGRREVMECAQKTFISSTFWTERIGPSAALKVLDVMERINSWQLITDIGLGIRHKWDELAKKYNLVITHSGLPSLASFSFCGKNSLAYKTFITQEMMTKGYLASNAIYVCIDHSFEVIEGYFQALEPIFATIEECEGGRDIMTLLKGPISHGGFKRLN